MATEAQTTEKTRTFNTYDDVKRRIDKLNDAYSNRNVARETQKLLDDVHKFCDDHKIECEYRIALPSPNDSNAAFDNAGIELGKVKMPKTLVTYLMSKTKQDKVSNNKLFAMLLLHQKFNVKMSSKFVRVCFADASKLGNATPTKATKKQ